MMNENTVSADALTQSKIFECLPGHHLLVKANSPVYTIVSASDELLKAIGRTPDEIIGIGAFEVFPKNPNDPDFLEANYFRKSFEVVTETKQPHELPQQRFDIPKNDGTIGEHYWSASHRPVLDEQGNVDYIIHTAVDITQQVKATQTEVKPEEINNAYQLLMKAPVAVCIVKGKDFNLELANDGMLQLMGRTREIVGHPIVHAFPEAQAQGLLSILERVHKTGEPHYANTFPAELLINGERETRYFDLIFTLYNDAIVDSSDTSIFCVGHNVTEQVLARKKMEEVQAALAFRTAIFEAQNAASTDGISIVDTRGKLLLSNKRFEEIWNIPQQVIEAKEDNATLQVIISHLVDPTGFMERVEQLYNEHSEPSQDTLVLKNGTVIERHGSPVVAEDGTFYGWAWHYRDVTERIMQEQKFNNVVQQATNPILILKGEDMVLEVANKALFELWQVDETALGKKFLEILPEMESQGFFELLQKVYTTGEPFHGFERPVTFERSNGVIDTLYFNFSYQAYREANGTITGVLIMARDVSSQVLIKQQLLESERNLRNTILQAPVAMGILKGEDYTIDIVNNKMTEFWGKSSHEVLNKPLWQAVPEARNEVFENLLAKVYATEETVVEYGLPMDILRRGKISSLYGSVVFSPFREGNGEVTGIMVIMLDVTDQVLARQRLEANESELQRRVDERTLELENINNELKRSNANLEEFAYAASHDLKSPVRKITFFAEKLKIELNDKLDERQRDLFNRMQNATNRMLFLIDDLLTFSHVSKGIADIETVDLNQRISTVLEDLELEVAEIGAQIEVDNLPQITGNKRQVQQLFQNLVGNAIKYHKPGVPSVVKIKAAQIKGEAAGLQMPAEELDNDFHLIEVIDNGIGFQQEDAERIFKVFTRLHGISEYSGTGIGLSIVQKVMENHKGYTWAESKPGDGATFKLLFPVAENV